ncbi:MAG TPA: hypothetical protein VFO44_14570 [Steroidobacteraceae bacterium]|nr:hypothetical protein [Steroidobacteraceae bacterium]
MAMSALRSLGTRLAVPVAVASLLSGVCFAAEGTPPGEAGEQAVWTQKELNFTFQGFTTHYSCDGLKDKMTRALLQLGANKKDLQVHETGCVRGFGRPDFFPGVRIKMMVLQPAASSTDASQTAVAAHWKPVAINLRDINSYPNDSGECELYEQIRDKVLPLFTTRNVSLSGICVPHQESAAGPSLKMEVLQPDTQSVPVASTK